jgi:hypothetical protein
VSITDETAIKLSPPALDIASSKEAVKANLSRDGDAKPGVSEIETAQPPALDHE